MKKSFFSLLFVCMVGFSGCIKDSDYVYNRDNVPVILGFSAEVMRLVMWSPVDGYCLVPNMPEEYGDGDVLLVNYAIDMKHQEYSNIYTATKVVVHSRINSSYIKEVPGGDFTDDYTTPVGSLFINPSVIDRTMYFGFQQKAPAGQIFDYEMLYDPGTTELYPTVYIKSKKANEVTGAETDIKTAYGFDMTAFLHKYRNNDENTVRFYVKILTDISGGKEVYTPIGYEPFTWELPSE